MNAADWNTLYRIGLGISFLLFLFSMIVLLYGGVFLVGAGGFRELGLSGLFVCGIFFVIAGISHRKFEEEEKLEKQPNLVSPKNV